MLIVGSDIQQFGNKQHLVEVDCNLNSLAGRNITEEELKHFYKDYKNYYYIPEEGQAIHKSVAAYVDTSFKEKATKENCFTKKKGDFLPAVCELEIPRFKLEYNSTDEYFLFNDTFLNDESVIRKYCAGIIKSL